MKYVTIGVPAELSSLIEGYWFVHDPDISPKTQKIIPDGFTEIIIHHGDPYSINLSGDWQLQPELLLAGQIDRHFYLRNTGKTAITGIKFKPTSLSYLFGLNMTDFTNQVVELSEAIGWKMKDVITDIRKHDDKDKITGILNEFFISRAPAVQYDSPVNRAVNLILKRHGMMDTVGLCDASGLGERQLENHFRRYVGLSPKRFARVIRFAFIFHLVDKNKSWGDIAYEAAFYDQSHFIRNFREFTGESPAAYAFDEKNLANFFLKKTSH